MNNWVHFLRYDFYAAADVLLFPWSMALIPLPYWVFPQRLLRRQCDESYRGVVFQDAEARMAQLCDCSGLSQMCRWPCTPCSSTSLPPHSSGLSLPPGCMRGKNCLKDACFGYIREHYAEKISLAKLADEIYVHPTYLSNLFKSQTRKTVVEYINQYRIEMAI